MEQQEQPNYEQAKGAILIKQGTGPDSQSHAEEGEVADFAGPQGPPTPLVRNLPPHLQPVVDWLASIVADEGLLLDICLERAIGIVDYHHRRGLAGIDHFPEATGGKVMTRAELVTSSIPLAVRLYDESLKAVDARKEEFQKLVAEVQANANGKQEPKATIIVPNPA